MEAISPQLRWAVILAASRGTDHPTIAAENGTSRKVVDLILDGWIASKQLMRAHEPSVKKDAAIRLVKEGWAPYVVWMNYYYSISLQELETHASRHQ